MLKGLRPEATSKSMTSPNPNLRSFYLTLSLESSVRESLRLDILNWFLKKSILSLLQKTIIHRWSNYLEWFFLGWAATARYNTILKSRLYLLLSYFSIATAAWQSHYLHDCNLLYCFLYHAHYTTAYMGFSFQSNFGNWGRQTAI